MENREAMHHLIELYDNLEKFFSQMGYHLKDEYTNARTLAISALERQEQDRWHSVAKEGNPKESDGYLVSSNDKIVFVLYYSLEHGWDGWWNDRITAWRPFPEPYTEDEA